MENKNTDAIVFFGKALAKHIMSSFPADTDAAEELIFLVYLFTCEGHVCMDTQNAALPGLIAGLYESYGIDCGIPHLERCTQIQDQFPDVFGKNNEFKPLICNDGHTYYFHKHYRHEVMLSEHINCRLNGNDRVPQIDKNALMNALPMISTAYRSAVMCPLQSNLTVITGGPGTGKTTAIIHILRVFATALKRKPVFYLCAPTGKASARLKDAIVGEKKKLSETMDATVLEFIPETAHTIHSIINYREKHDGRLKTMPHPKSADCVIVDESSMMDLFLATALFNAFLPTTRFVLIGDTNQLSSVEAGSVFRDIYDALNENGQYGRSLFTLTKAYRFLKNGALSLWANTVLNGDADEFFRLADTNRSDIGYHDLTAAEIDGFINHYAEKIEHWIVDLTPAGYRGYIRESALLTPLRRGLFGCEYINRRIEAIVKNKRRIHASDEWYPGRKIIVLVNRGEFNNGDIAVCLDNGDGELRLFFDKDTRQRDYPLYTVSAYEPAYALTVHKSQGSEYGSVDILFPDTDSPLLGRELLYTAVTRAKKKVTVFGNRHVISKSIQRKTFRETGLKKRLCLPS